MCSFLRSQLKALVVLFVASQAHALNCSNVDEVAKEAIEFSMLGAGIAGMNSACYANQSFRYFKPEEAYDETDDASEAPGSTTVWFDPARDKYTFMTKKEGDFVQIKAIFSINGRKLRTTYTYQPLDYAQEEAGVCGLIYNDMHEILRSDCRAKR